MSNKAKSAILLLIIIMIGSLCLAGYVFYNLQKEKAANSSLRDKLDEVETKHRIVQTELDQSKQIITTLEAKLKEDGGQIESLAKELEQEKNSKQEVLARVEELNQNLEQQKKIKIDLEKKIDQAQESAKKMQAQLKELESKKAELEAKVKSIETEIPGVELGEIVVTPDTTVTTKEPAAKPKKQKTEKDLAAQELKGAVLVVNKEYNFVVINLGSKDGVGLGDVFSVSRSNKYIGDIKVEKIHESMSAAGFVSSDMKGKVNEGDKVVQKVK